MKKIKVLITGLILLVLGIIFIIISGLNDLLKLIGVIEFTIGMISINAYCSEKIRFLKTIKLCFKIKGYQLSITKQKWITYIIMLVLFITTATLWGFLSYKNIITQVTFKVIGFIVGTFTTIQLYIATSKPSVTDVAEYEEIINGLIKIE